MSIGFVPEVVWEFAQLESVERATTLPNGIALPQRRESTAKLLMLRTSDPGL